MINSEDQLAKIDYFNDERISSIGAQLASDGRDVIVIATHTLPPMGPGSFAHRNRHLQLLADRVRQLRQAEPDVPVVVVGDLNLTPWSPVFSEFLAQAELTTSRGGLGVTPTWYRFPLFPFGLVLDHVLTTPDLSTVSYDVGDDMGSDHRMVTASFRFAGDSQRRDVAKRNGNR